MAKFNPNLKIGSGLLNEASKNAITTERLPLVPLEYIVRNPNNKIYEEGETKPFDESEIESLAENINEVGLQQNLVVMKRSETEYLLISGHRRFEAIQFIIATQMSRRNELKKVPCKIIDIDNISIPLNTPEEKEEYALLSGNIDNRNKKPYQIIAEIDRFNQLIEKAISNGFKINGKRRTFIANRMGISETATQRALQISKGGTEEVKEAIKKENISIDAAAKLSKENKDLQKEVIKSSESENKPLTSSNISQAIEQISINQATAVERAKQAERESKHRLITEEKPDLELVPHPQELTPEPTPEIEEKNYPLAKTEYKEFVDNLTTLFKNSSQLLKEYKDIPVQPAYDKTFKRINRTIEKYMGYIITSLEEAINTNK